MTSIFNIAKGANVHLVRNVCIFSYLGNHYDTLGISRESSSKEIRDAFIELSKKHHPDKSRNDPTKHREFVKLNEAYSTLSRPDKRRLYDSQLVFDERKPYNQSNVYNVYESESSKHNAWNDSSFYANRNFKDEKKSYYGFKNVNRASNGLILILILLFCSFGVGAQILAICWSKTFSRNALEENSKKNAVLLGIVRARAAKNGNEEQIKQMEKLMLKQENVNNDDYSDE